MIQIVQHDSERLCWEKKYGLILASGYFLHFPIPFFCFSLWSNIRERKSKGFGVSRSAFKSRIQHLKAVWHRVSY